MIAFVTGSATKVKAENKIKWKILRHSMLRLLKKIMTITTKDRAKEILNPGTHINTFLEYMIHVNMYFGSELFQLFHTVWGCTSHHKVTVWGCTSHHKVIRDNFSLLTYRLEFIDY